MDVRARLVLQLTPALVCACSTPFHLRFGKMSVLRPAERKVCLSSPRAVDEALSDARCR